MSEQTQILSQVARYGLTVAAAVSRLPCFAQDRQSTAEHALDRLRAAGLINWDWLYPGQKYYSLAPRGAAQVDLPIDQRRRRARWSHESTIRRFAMLAFCCFAQADRTRLTGPELVARCGGLNARQAGDYYVQSPPTSALGRLRVDMGGCGRWDRVLAKCIEDARRIVSCREWQPVLEAGQFEITIVTPLPQKVERLCRAIRDLPMPPGVPIRVTAIPELLHLIVPPPE